MFIREVKNLIDKNLYNRCMDLSRDYFDKTFYKFPELQLWAESTRRYIIQIWRLQDLLKIIVIINMGLVFYRVL